MTFETFDQNDEGIWPDQQKYNENDKYKDKDNDKDKYIKRTHSKRNPRLESCDLWDIWSEWLWTMTWPKKDHDKDKDKDKDNDKDKYI